MEGFQSDLCLFDFRVGNWLYKELVGVDYLSLELKKGFEILEWKYGSRVKSLVQIDSSVCFSFFFYLPMWLIDILALILRAAVELFVFENYGFRGELLVKHG